MKAVKLIIIPWLLLFIASMLYAQSDVTVYVTKTGAKYHSAGCSYLKKSAIPMKLSDAATAYSPCSRCNPPVISASGKDTSNSSVNKTQNNTSNQPVGTQVGTTPTGKPIYVGPRGGQYHYSKSGKKVYQRRK